MPNSSVTMFLSNCTTKKQAFWSSTCIAAVLLLCNFFFVSWDNHHSSSLETTTTQTKPKMKYMTRRHQNSPVIREEPLYPLQSSPPNVHRECRNITTLILKSASRPFSNQYQNLSSFLDGQGLLAAAAAATTASATADDDDTNKIFKSAVCYFFETPISKHFPHAMQQFYRCWSWWRSHPDLQAVLVGPANHRGFRPVQRRDFFTNLLDVLVQTKKDNQTTTSNQSFLQIRTYSPQVKAGAPIFEIANSNTDTELVVQSNFDRGDDFAMATPQHALDLRKTVRQQQQAPFNNDGVRNWETGCPIREDTSKALPRIAVLNRDVHTSRRSILNAETLAAYLQQTFYYNSTHSSDSVPVVYFENKTFWEQVQFWDNTDIVISPHGAQLIAIPFIPSCGAVLEIFPVGLYMPYYFGSLANASGAAYTALYMTKTQDWKAENAQNQINARTRQRTRRQNMCPSIEAVVEETASLIRSWRVCCAQRSMHRSP